jgi:hypothetical protein
MGQKKNSALSVMRLSSLVGDDVKKLDIIANDAFITSVFCLFVFCSFVFLSFCLWSLVFGLWSLVVGLYSLVVFGLCSLLFGLVLFGMGLPFVFGIWSCSIVRLFFFVVLDEVFQRTGRYGVGREP